MKPIEAHDYLVLGIEPKAPHENEVLKPLDAYTFDDGILRLYYHTGRPKGSEFSLYWDTKNNPLQHAMSLGEVQFILGKLFGATAWQTRYKFHQPASKLAIYLGCRCAVMDNHFGKGLTAGYGTPDSPAFWMQEDCPLHGKDKDRFNY
jgi:hypothetical protein